MHAVSHTRWDVLKFIFSAKPTMFIQWALSAFPDLTPSHNGNAAAEEVGSQALRSIRVQPAAGSAASDGSSLVVICYVGAQKQFVQQLVNVNWTAKLLSIDLLRLRRKQRNLTTSVSFSEKKTNMDILTTRTWWGHNSVFSPFCSVYQSLDCGGSNVKKDARTILSWATSPSSSRKTSQHSKESWVI